MGQYTWAGALPERQHRLPRLAFRVRGGAIRQAGPKGRESSAGHERAGGGTGFGGDGVAREHARQFLFALVLGKG